jgi:hypothetical protein
MNPNPVVMLIVSLLAATAVTHNRISFTKRASAYDGVVAGICPVGRKLVRQDGN